MDVTYLTKILKHWYFLFIYVFICCKSLNIVVIFNPIIICKLYAISSCVYVHRTYIIKI